MSDKTNFFLLNLQFLALFIMDPDPIPIFLPIRIRTWEKRPIRIRTTGPGSETLFYRSKTKVCPHNVPVIIKESLIIVKKFFSSFVFLSVQEGGSIQYPTMFEKVAILNK